MLEMWNSVIRGHVKQKPKTCSLPNFVLATEEKWGAAWKCSVKCTKCGFTSPVHKLYSEVHTGKRGPKPASVNLTLQSGLMDTPISNSWARLLMADLDIPPPVRNSMQKLTNYVNTKTARLNTLSMREKITEVKSINARGGAMDPNVINVAVDGRYNCITIGHSKKSGQGASQAIALACETNTEHKYILAAVMQNKLCWIGAWMKGKGMQVECPGGHEGCTANLVTEAPLSELDMGRALGTEFALQNVLIKFATTDGDGRAAQGIEESLQYLHPMWKVERLADPTHLAASQFRQCSNAKFSDNMFPGKTKLEKGKFKKILSQDVKARCSLIVKNLLKDHCGNIQELKKRLPKILQATILCYDGDCSKCRVHSVVCNGNLRGNWWIRSMFLAANKFTGLQMEDNDKFILNEILKIRLSEEAIIKTRFNTNTQKCEALNRSLSVSLPNNVNYGRNAMGRLSSTILRNNIGIKGSTEGKANYLGAKLSSKTRHSLTRMENERKYYSQYKNRPAVKKRNLFTRGRKLYSFAKYKQSHSVESGYKEGQLDFQNRAITDNSLEDHSYSQ
ncbi:hypothetical protein SNE40_010853 [Patella caerulea]|uniref:Mutator-like transposase domain-containing protein n=1 Tax=Patella caerulea TaxID=87958 RepID=A0AAN8K1T4_PATCE